MGLQYQAEMEMSEVIEKQIYDVENTITLRIPVSLPYQMFAEGFQHIRGEFEYNGEFYNLIKQKISNDTLYIVCMENVSKSEISGKKALFEKITIDWRGVSKKTYNLLIYFAKDFLQNSRCEVIPLQTWMMEFSFLSSVFDTKEGNITSDTPPPKNNVSFGFIYLSTC
jgi:hypothetical protein